MTVLPNPVINGNGFKSRNMIEVCFLLSSYPLKTVDAAVQSRKRSCLNYLFSICAHGNKNIKILSTKILLNIACRNHYLDSRCTFYSIEIGLLRNFTKFTEKHLCQSLFFNKVAGLRPTNLLKKRIWYVFL